MRFDVLHHVNLFFSLVGLVIAISLAYLGFSFMALAWGHLLSTMLRSILLIIIQPKRSTMLPSFHYRRSVLNFGGLMSITSIMGIVNTEGMKFAVAAVISPAALAFFEGALQLPNLARQMLWSSPTGHPAKHIAQIRWACCRSAWYAGGVSL